MKRTIFRKVPGVTMFTDNWGVARLCWPNGDVTQMRHFPLVDQDDYVMYLKSPVYTRPADMGQAADGA